MTPALLIISCESCPVASGSGKVGNPWARRHRAKAMSAWVLAWRCAGVPSGPVPPLGRMWLHAAWALLNAGWPEIVGLMAMATLVLPPDVVTTGSGKLAIPWLRMQAEN